MRVSVVPFQGYNLLSIGSDLPPLVTPGHGGTLNHSYESVVYVEDERRSRCPYVWVVVDQGVAVTKFLL